MRHFLLASLGAMALAGCVTQTAPVEVTRFHVASVPTRQTVAIAAAGGMTDDSLEFRSHANAVAAALTRAGFTVVEQGRLSELVAQVSLDRLTELPGGPRGNPVSVGVGGSTGSYGGGVGVGIGIDLSGPPKPLVRSRLSVQIVDRATNAALWEGRAETAAKQGSPAAQPGLAAGRLAEALFRDYPGRSGETITVR